MRGSRWEAAVAVRSRLQSVTARTDQAGGLARIWLAALFAVGVALPVVSSVLGLFDRVQHWGKVVHGVDAFVATLLFALLLLGWRDAEAIAVSDELSAVMAMCAGVFFGVIWEIVEFVFDWVTYSDLQKSN